ncbi:MAG TPA: L,D-transpeptidase, partial [Thermoanaerobacterales bacterium]|nr:L,D-transpeptidase [Thermoanaerobacterales bacterium]
MKRLASIAFTVLLLNIFCATLLASENRKIVLNVPMYTLEYYEGNTLVKTYPVAIGRSTSQTPIGDFKV